MCALNLAVNDLPLPVSRRSSGALALSLAGPEMQRRCSGPGPARDRLTGSLDLDASHKLPSPPGPALTWVMCVKRDNGHPQALWFTPGLLIPHSART